MQQFTFGAILPHTLLFGGVRRFFELGEIFIKNGHKMVILTPEGKKPDWFDFSGDVDALANIGQYRFSSLFITEPKFLPDLLKANATHKIFYHVGPRASLTEVLKHKEIRVFANSSNIYLYDNKKYGIKPVKAYGGVHVPAEPKLITKNNAPCAIMCYGRLSRKGKGTHIVVRAVEKLYRKGYNVKLILFDTPIDTKSEKLINAFKTKAPFEFIKNHPVLNNAELFKKADIFVAVEKKGGWSNTAAEAMAAGVPVVVSKTGTKDFVIHNQTGLKVIRHSYFVTRALKRLIDDIELRKRLAKNGREKIKEFSWENLARFIISFQQSPEKFIGVK